MTDFSHLKDLAVDSTSTTVFTFARIMGSPALTVRPAHRVNRDFLNEMIATAKDPSRAVAKGSTDDEMLDQIRESDIDIFARCIVTGWEGVVDSNGDEVEFAEDHVRQFLAAIPADMFDDLRVFCLNIDNFREGRRRSMDPQEEEALSGN